ncbi:MAG: release factor glutamine methyltransferase, partial [Verrucomicrobiota bacterium]
TVEFCGHIFVSDKRALVPRPETEELVELLLSALGSQKSDVSIADVGTGSGVIALSLAAKLPAARITAIDISDDALALARENAEKLGLSERVRFNQGDLFQNITERFDLIVANLPYVSSRARSSLSREVLHDPAVALFGGEEGDEMIRQLVNEAPPRLATGGLLALEIGMGQMPALAEALAQKNYHDIESKTDYAGTPRFLLARYG